MDKYLSIITNFGCHYKCPYCIVKNTGINVPKTTVDGLDRLVENIEKYECNWVSISGGGDPLHNWEDHCDWWGRLFSIVPKNVKTELHTSYFDPPSHLATSFDRIVYHCHKPEDLFRIYRFVRLYGRPRQITRAVFVVTEDFTPELINEIATLVKFNPCIDELSFRQMVDKDYNATHYCEEYLKAGHQKDWWYIQQCDYNIYYAENEVKFKYEDFRRNADAD